MTKPANMKKQIDTLVDKIRIDPMAKFKMRKQAAICQDRSK